MSAPSRWTLLGWSWDVDDMCMISTLQPIVLPSSSHNHSAHQTSSDAVKAYSKPAYAPAHETPLETTPGATVWPGKPRPRAALEIYKRSHVDITMSTGIKMMVQHGLPVSCLAHLSPSAGTCSIFLASLFLPRLDLELCSIHSFSLISITLLIFLYIFTFVTLPLPTSGHSHSLLAQTLDARPLAKPAP